MENKNLKLTLMSIAVVIGVYLGLKFIFPLVFPFIVAYLIACIIRPLTNFLNKKLKFKRAIAATLSLITLLIVFSMSIYYIFKTCIDQLIKFIRNVPRYLESISYRLESICANIDKLLGFDDGSMKFYMNGHLDGMKEHLKNNLMPKLTEGSISFVIKIFAGFGIFFIIMIATLMIVKDMEIYSEKYKKSKFYGKMHKVTDSLAKAGVGYIKAQGTIALIVATVCTIGLILIKNQFSILIGIGIGIFDAFPVLGSGLILVPWSMIMLYKGNILAAAILMTTYLGCQIVRQVLEPKLLGNNIGVSSICTLMSVYVGIRLFSVSGFILGPLGLIMIITIIKSLKENLNLT